MNEKRRSERRGKKSCETPDASTKRRRSEGTSRFRRRLSLEPRGVGRKQEEGREEGEEEGEEEGSPLVQLGSALFLSFSCSRQFGSFEVDGELAVYVVFCSTHFTSLSIRNIS